MKQRWTLYFENLGRIEKGEVRIAPMMIFTGDNNAGKSYVMALLWGIIALGRDLIFQKEPPESESFKLCDQWLLAHWGQDTEIDEAAGHLFANWFSESLHQRRKLLCSGIFGDGRVQPRVLRVRNFIRNKPLKLRWDANTTEGGRYSSGADYVRFPVESSENSLSTTRYRMIRYLTWNLLMGDLSSPLFPMRQSFTPTPRGEILYLPAARTGFVLMRKVLASGLLGMGGSDALPLNTPTRRFLQRLLSLTHSDSSKYSAIADHIESDLLHGTVKPDASPLPDYQYQPAGINENALPLWLTSSLVTELTPLLMFLRSKEDFRSLIIEEPEAHLHLALQSRLARILARLVNAGLPVWITTHGDSFFQQLSNLVKASTLSKKELLKTGFEKSETLAIDDVCAFQFKIKEAENLQRNTEIHSLHTDHSGIAGAAFNESITQLTDQTLALNALQDARHEN